MTVWHPDVRETPASAGVSVYGDLVSEIYDLEGSWYGHVTEEEIEFYLSVIGGRRGLELGTGTGRVAVPLLERGADLYGLEGSAQMFSLLQKTLPPEHRPRFIHWDARRVPYPAPDETFEAVIIPFSTFGLVHDRVEDPGSNFILKELNRLLVPGSVLVLNDYRTGRLDPSLPEQEPSAETGSHNHPEHGSVREEQQSRYRRAPNRLFPDQILRERRTRFIRERDGEVLEQHLEVIPLWDVDDFQVLARDAGFRYLKRESCEFHPHSSSLHFMVKEPAGGGVP
jgi:SAM-dependent methyltransferase